MLLRLHIKNFKSLRDAVVQFGPFSCLVGPNGVGKSNVFDAIQFLRSLAELDIQSAAQAVRTSSGGGFSPKELFWGGNTEEPISLEADMMVPWEVNDDFGRPAVPATTLLKYHLQLRCSSAGTRLEIASEELSTRKTNEAREVIGFKHDSSFLKSVLKTTRRSGPLISTDSSNGNIRLMLHQDGGSRGQPIPAGASPRTVVGGTNAAEYPTVLAARREMASWNFLHLEPSVMRAPDVLGGPSVVTEHGGHIAAALERLSRLDEVRGQTLQEASNRLAQLVPEVSAIELDRDDARQQLSVRIRMLGSNMALGPRALSDGTLRFLALVTLLLDPSASRILCMEEPENGMHPARIPAVVELLRDFAVDPKQSTGIDNPLRQVIINTHSPDVVRQMDPEDLLFVERLESPEGRSTVLSAVEHGWRKAMPTVPERRLIDFIGGAPLGPRAGAFQQELQFGTAY